MRHAIFLVLALGLPVPDLAQPADVLSERVIVTAPRLTPQIEAMIHDFIGARATPAQLLGQVPRWNRPLCPRTDGLSRDAYTAFVSQRIRVVANMAGAKLAPAPCNPNIQIFFTDNPEATLYGVKARDRNLLGYKGAQTITHPIQAWYVTGITDLDGRIVIDQDAQGSMDSQGGSSGGDGAAPGQITWTFPTLLVNGYRGKTDLRSDLANIVIIADKKVTANYKLAAVADYIAVLALTYTADFSSCQELPSITNLFAPGCPPDRRPEGLTDGDIGYLRGIYRMPPDQKLGLQQRTIAAEMKKSMGR